MLIVIAAVVEEALAPRVRDKGLYFCSAVKRRLIEQRLWPECAGANQTREEAEALGRDLAARFVGSEDALPAPAVVPPAAPRAPSEARARMQALLDAERRKGGDR